MTAKDFVAMLSRLQARLSLTDRQLCAELRIPEVTLMNWRAGHHLPPGNLRWAIGRQLAQKANRPQ